MLVIALVLTRTNSNLGTHWIKWMKLVKVKWVDPATTFGWVNAKKATLSSVTSVGILANETKKIICISTSLNDYGQYADPLVIPKSSILKLTRL